jgi:hypothetical protein
MSGFDADHVPGGCGGGLRVAERLHRNPTHGRQGKRPAFGAAYVVGKIKEFANVTNTRCRRFWQIVERFQSSVRRRSRFGQGAGS